MNMVIIRLAVKNTIFNLFKYMRLKQIGFIDDKFKPGYTFTFSHVADAFIQSDLQMRTMETIKINKRAMICKCYNKSQLA